MSNEVRKCKDWQLEYSISGQCPYCKAYFDFNNGQDKPERGDDLTCEECEKVFILG